MKHRILLAGIVLMCVAAVVVSERRKGDAPASPAAILYLVADTEHELTRMPVVFARMPDSEEIRIGDELAAPYSGKNERENDADVIAVELYLEQVGRPLASRAHRKLPYVFHYLSDSNLINAFALPGGHVFVGAGLLSLMETEDELAAVIGHEIEHVDHYHCAERAQQEQALRKIPLGGLIGLPLEVFEAGYSKDQELEADREGTRLAVEAGYSPNGAIRMFETLDRLHKAYMEQESRAGSPQEEAARVAAQAIEGYFRSHPLSSERIAQIQKIIASEGWSVRAERDLAVAYIFWTAKAHRELAGHRYAEAEQLATHTLRLKPDQKEALQVLADAQFAQANFAAAAGSYRKLLEIGPVNLDVAESYADALAAADRRTASAQFRQWTGTLKGPQPKEISAADAGLALLTGAPEAANQIASQTDRPDPHALQHLGWWFYRNGDFKKSADLLSEVVQARPNDVAARSHLALAQIELRRYADALETVSDVYGESDEGKRAIVRALAQWRSESRDAALIDFNLALNAQPEWANLNWVKGLYAPAVVQNVEEILAERELRRAKARVARP